MNKNALLLSKEIFSVTNDKITLDFAYYEILIPVIVPKTVYAKNFIKKIAFDTLAILETKFNYKIGAILS